MDITTDGASVVLSGHFDVRTTMQVRAAIHDRLAEHDNVVVDLTDVVAVDVTALKVLAAASHLALDSGQHITLRGCNGAVRRLLHLTHLIRAVDVDRHAVGA